MYRFTTYKYNKELVMITTFIDFSRKWIFKNADISELSHSFFSFFSFITRTNVET